MELQTRRRPPSPQPFHPLRQGRAFRDQTGLTVLPWGRKAFPGLLLLAVILALPLAGCRSAAGRPLPLPRILAAPRMDSALVVRELDRRRKTVQSLAASLQAVIRDKNRGKEFGLAGTLLADQNHNLRFALKYGETSVLDLGIYAGRVDLWMPRKKAFYRGSREEILAAPHAGLALLAQAGHALDFFFPEAWSMEAVRRSAGSAKGKETIKVFEKPGDSFRKSRVLYLSAAQPAVESMELFGPQGFLGSLHYADYRFPPARAGAGPEGRPALPYPGHVLAVSPDHAIELQMEIEEFEINLPLPASKFAVPPPENQEIRPLREALAKGLLFG